MPLHKVFLSCLLAPLLLSLGLTAQAQPYMLDLADFKVLFKAEPTKNVQKVPTALGELSLDMYMLEMVGEMDSVYAYLAMHSFYPKENVHSNNKELMPQFFEGVVNGAVQNVNGKLVSNNVIEAEGFPGRDVVIEIGHNEAEKAHIRMKIYLVENQMIMLQTVTPPNASMCKDATTFFASFVLKKKATTAP